MRQGRHIYLPSVEGAHAYLAAAGRRNPGPWVQHSVVAAEAARAIAARHPTLDPDAAYVLGLLHDVGRGQGGPEVADVRHILDGHHLMHERGFEDCARVCLTHSFPIKQADAFAGPWDCPTEDRRFVQAYLERVEYTAYDRLIPLCDALALPSGPVLMAKRLVDVALRWGFNELTVAKWRAYLALRREFSEAIGTSIYSLLPNIIDNTFAM
jgi:HD domain